MTKSILGISAVCCMAVAFLGGCNKNADDGCCGGACGDKAAVQEGTERPAAAKMEGTCADKAASCAAKKACCGAKKAAQQN